jgi:hypothetical protein
MLEKREYLVVYDYGTGGIWGIISANSPLEILNKYPQLQIVSSPPIWMTDEIFERDIRRRAFDISEPPPEWVRLSMPPTE